MNRCQRTRLIGFALVVGAVSILSPQAVRAQEAVPTASVARAGPSENRQRMRRFWDPAWRRVGALDYVWTGVSTTGLVLEAIFLQPHGPSIRWDDPILFDRKVRDWLRADSESAREAASAVSWGLFGTFLAYPALVDIPVAWIRGSKDLAWEFFWQDALVLTTAGAVDIAIRDLTGRARPRTTDCLEAGGTPEQCQRTNESARSFPGGHFAVATASAGLICTQHLHTRLYGGPWDALTCGTAIVADATIGVMRIVSDAHWATDVIAGGALGALIGVGLPHLLWYRGGAPRDRNRYAASARPVFVPMPVIDRHATGLGVAGVL